MPTPGTQRTRLRVDAWFGEREIELNFPANWEVDERRMAGHDRTALTDEEMQVALHNPIDSPRLSEIARGKKEVVILFDDITKPTPTYRIIPFVLEELHAADIDDDHIRFLCAAAAHRYPTYRELVSKLGAEILERYPVYYHNIYENTVYVGTTSRGTPVHVNREYASCDLRLGIGGIIPHQRAGFSAGGKIVIPGIAGIETITAHHSGRATSVHPSVRMGAIEDNPFRLDLEEGARIAGLQFKVDCVINNRREVVGLFAGDVIAEHRAGVKLAREVYQTELAKGADVLILNSYPDESQLQRCNWLVPLSLREGGDVVIIGMGQDVQNLHQYRGRFGTDFGGRGWTADFHAARLATAGRVFLLAPHLTKLDRDNFGVADKLIWCKDWGAILAELTTRHGPGTKGVVYPYPPIQVIAQ